MRSLARGCRATPTGLQLQQGVHLAAPISRLLTETSARSSSSTSSSCLAARQEVRAGLRSVGEGAAALLAAVAAVGLASGSVLLAKEKKGKCRYEVYMWGRAEGVPGNPDRDVLWPTKFSDFDSNEAGWSKIAFGPNFGVALDGHGKLVVWGETAEEGSGTLAVELGAEASGRTFVDVQCSADKIFAVTSRGHVFLFADVVGVLRENQSKNRTVKLEGHLVPGLPQPGLLSSVVGGAGIKSMSIGLEHGCFLSKTGEVYCVGANEWGQCAQKPPKQKGVIGALQDRKRIQVENPTKVELPPDSPEIVEIQVGGRHTMLRDANGTTYSFGDDRRIQLGLGDTRTRGVDTRNAIGVLTQDSTAAKATEKLIQRNAGYRYYDPHMQSIPQKTLEPEVYNRPPYPPPSFLALGEDFSIAVHRDSPDWYSKEQETNVIMCCGENAEGQCGRGLQDQQHAWRQVRMPKRSKTAAVTCGQQHCLALLTNGELYSWGASLQGQLGSGKRATRPKPTKLGLQPDPQAPLPDPVNVAPQGHPPEWHAPKPDQPPFPGKIVSITAGFRNSAVICEVPVE